MVLNRGTEGRAPDKVGTGSARPYTTRISSWKKVRSNEVAILPAMKKLRFPSGGSGGAKFALSGNAAFQFAGGAAVVQDEMK